MALIGSQLILLLISLMCNQRFVAGDPYGSVCTIDVECDGELICPFESLTCACPSTQYYEPSDFTCHNLKGYSFTCDETYECQDTLACLDSACVCLSTHFYNFFTKNCKIPHPYGDSCDFTFQCATSLTCLSGICDCQSSQFFNTTIQACQSRLPYESTCVNDTQCQEAYFCVSDVCDCQTTEFLNRTSLDCQPRISQVENLTAEMVTSTSGRVSWHAPQSAPGEIEAFLVTVIRTDLPTCLQAFWLSCSDCVSHVNYTVDCQVAHGFNFTTREASNASHQFVQEIESLHVYTHYTATVTGVDSKHFGLSSTISFRTKVDVAQNILSLTVHQTRDVSSKQVGLFVQWLSGACTGPTNYTVTLTDTGTNTVTGVLYQSGYENTNASFSDLMAYHSYKVSVFAETAAGRSLEIKQSDPITTYTNVPGTARNVTIIRYSDSATNFSLNFDCPCESDRNGSLIGFTVVKRTSYDSSSVLEEMPFPIEDLCVISLKSNLLGPILMGYNYSFTVIIQNSDYNSTETLPVFFSAEAIPPVFEDPSEIIWLQVGTISSNSFEIKLSLPRLTDNFRGTVRMTALLVCVEKRAGHCSQSKRRKRSISLTSEEEIANAPTWAWSRQNQFNSTYRATPDDWHISLQLQANAVDEYSYIVGGNESCSIDADLGVHCNGPLPSGNDVIVSVTSCNDAGCASAQLEVTVSSEEEDSNSHVSVIISVTVLAVLYIIVFVVAVVVCGRKRAKGGEVCPDGDSRLRSGSVCLRNFHDLVLFMGKKSNKLFQKEFKKLKTKILPSLSEDQYANRLFTGHGTDTSAVTFISGLNNAKEYIITTVLDGMDETHPWQAVWSENSPVIVTLNYNTSNQILGTFNAESADAIGRGMFKFENGTVQNLSYSSFNSFDIRLCQVSCEGGTRSITHFLVRGWGNPDGGLTFEDILHFTRRVREKMDEGSPGPMTICCTSSLSTVTTFIILDYFMQFIQRNGLDCEINVKDFISDIHKQAPGLVETLKDYMVIYDTIDRLVRKKLDEEKIL